MTSAAAVKVSAYGRTFLTSSAHPDALSAPRVRGAPFTGAAKTISLDAVEDGAIGPMPTGYTILDAESLAAAAALARGCPLLKSGRQAVIYETISM